MDSVPLKKKMFNVKTNEVYASKTLNTIKRVVFWKDKSEIESDCWMYWKTVLLSSK